MITGLDMGLLVDQIDRSLEIEKRRLNSLQGGDAATQAQRTPLQARIQLLTSFRLAALSWEPDVARFESALRRLQQGDTSDPDVQLLLSAAPKYRPEYLVRDVCAEMLNRLTFVSNVAPPSKPSDEELKAFQALLAQLQVHAVSIGQITPALSATVNMMSGAGLVTVEGGKVSLTPAGKELLRDDD
jgi:hypothetical protein